jgi:hypothetical protein
MLPYLIDWNTQKLAWNIWHKDNWMRCVSGFECRVGTTCRGITKDYEGKRRAFLQIDNARLIIDGDSAIFQSRNPHCGS